MPKLYGREASNQTVKPRLRPSLHRHRSNLRVPLWTKAVWNLRQFLHPQRRLLVHGNLTFCGDVMVFNGEMVWSHSLERDHRPLQ